MYIVHMYDNCLCTYVYVHVHTHAHKHNGHVHNTYTHLHTCTHTLTHTSTGKHMHMTHTARVHAHTHTHIQTHTHTHIPHNLASSPCYRLSRVCVKETSMKGATIPKDTRVEIPVNFMHHLYSYWNNPHSFCPDRYNACTLHIATLPLSPSPI